MEQRTQHDGPQRILNRYKPTLEDSRMNRYELIAWTRWTDSGYSSAPSKGHIEGTDGLTLCRVRIPTAGNGMEVDNAADLGADDCATCRKLDEKRS